LGWSQSKPTDSEGKQGKKTQAEMAEENGGVIEYPPVRCDYLWGWFLSVGLCESGAMGAIPLTANELRAWSAGAVIELDHWEFTVLLRASRAYCGQLNKPDDTPPYGDPDALYDDDVIAERLERSLSLLAG